MDLPASVRSGTSAAPLVDGFATEWRAPLLTMLLRAGSVVAILGPLLSGLFRREWTMTRTGVVALGVLMLLQSRRRTRSPRAVSWIMVSSMFMVLVTLGMEFAWAPVLVAALCFLVVVGGLLLGTWLVVALVISVGACLVAGGLAVRAGLLLSGVSPELDPHVFSNWLRVAVLYTLTTGAAAWVLRAGVEVVARGQAAARAAYDAARVALTATSAARADRLRTEGELLNAQKLQAVSQLGDGFAHLVNNVITVVRCAVEDAAHEPSPATRRLAAESIRSAVVACARRTGDMLSLSRPHRPAGAPSDLEDAVRAAGRRVAERLRANVVLTLEPEPVGAVALEPSQLEQTLVNLVLNAEQAMERGGTIRVITRAATLEAPATLTTGVVPSGTYAVLVVEDDGPGMPREVAERACEPFFTTRGRAGHDGLGLALVHSMAAQIGGGVDIDHAAPGARVSVYFPVLPAAGAAPAEATRATTDHRPPPGSTASPVAAGPPMSTDESAWRVEALEATAHTAAGLMAVAVGLTAVATDFHASSPTLLAGTLLVAVLVAVARAVTVPHRVRLGVLLGALLLLGGVVVIRNSFLSPLHFSLLPLVVFLAAVHAGRGATAAALMLTGAVILAGGVVWSGGYPHNHLADFDPGRPANWFRIALTLPFGIILAATGVLRVFAAAQRVTADLEHARRQLDQSRLEHHDETEALVRIAAARGRASRIEAAGRLTGMIAHDLNNSLTTLLGWAEVLEEAEHPSERDAALRGLQHAADYAEGLVHQMESGAAVSHSGPGLDVAQALARMHPLLEAVVRPRGAHGVSLEVNAEPGAWVAIHDASLRRLIMNLLTNARDALQGRNGTCRVGVRRKGDHVVLEVTDDGCGMDAATRARLFEAFFSTKAERGTGLGLHSVSEIVTATGGRIEVESTEGKGSTFSIHWAAATPSPVQAPQAVSAPQRGASARILLAEDDQLVRALLSRGMRSAGFEVVEAADGDAAAAALEADGAFDALCTDAVMPGRPTDEVLRAFMAAYPGRPALLMSGYLPEEFAAYAGVDGAVTFLRKPFSHVQLVQVLQQALDGARQGSMPG